MEGRESDGTIAHVKSSSLILLASFSLLPIVALSQGCGDDPVEEKRRGGEGEACQRADDCIAPLPCINQVCGGTEAGGAGGTGGSPSTGGNGAGASGGAGGSGAMGGEGGQGGALPEDCHECLGTTCSAELAACDGDCFDIEACIETYCRSPGLDASEESNCFVACQNLNASSKQQHIDVAICAADESCDQVHGCFQCLYEPDHGACVNTAKAGACQTEFDACDTDSACNDFLACVSTCTTASDCFACDDPAPTSADKYEAYQRCVAEQCILTSWISIICG